MQLDYETLNKTITAVVPAVVLAIGAFFTARNITTKIERMKLDAQADLEKQRLEYQASLERERMEFQRESESQKQRMELYKTLYTERINASKILYGVIGSIIQSSMQKDAAAMERYITELRSVTNNNHWLFSGEIIKQVRSFHTKAKNCQENNDFNVNELAKAGFEVSAAITRMMHNADLSDMHKG